ncbi:MAG: mandelate racemase/muconate lactonizing enzyme family protein [Pseudomonadota bacterium]
MTAVPTPAIVRPSAAPRIGEIHLYRHELPVKDGPYRIASSSIWSLTTTLVKLVANDGTVGWGETCPVGPTYAEAHSGGALAALQAMAPDLVGCDVRPQPLHRRMDSLLNGHKYAKAAIDIAAHDLWSRTLGVSVSDILGGALTDNVPSYYAIGVSEPDEAGRIAAEKAAQGYMRLQIKVGARAVEADIAAIRKVWEAISDTGIRLTVDGNRSFTTGDALRITRECPKIPFVFEQPCATLAELQRLRPLCQHPLYLDESGVDLDTAVTAAGAGLADGFSMKITRIGGLQPMRAFRDLCAARNLPHTCDDSWGGDIISAACTHVGATVAPERMEGVWLAQPYVEGHYDPDGGIAIRDGHIARPQSAGLGVTPDEGIFGPPVFSA